MALSWEFRFFGTFMILALLLTVAFQLLMRFGDAIGLSAICAVAGVATYKIVGLQ